MIKPRRHTHPTGDAADAAAYRLLMSSGHVADLVRELLEYERRAVSTQASKAVSAALDARRAGSEYRRSLDSFATIHKRRYPPDGDVHRWVAHTEAACPSPPCWCYAEAPCRYPLTCRREVCR